ncbi:hypothetical protein C0J52_11232 [Blattella germanica]|nr:hypothetical protein C0J52_11232 [Blattella germanica]
MLQLLRVYKPSFNIQYIISPIINSRYLAAFSKESGAWLHAVSSPTLGLHLPNKCFRISAALRLGPAVCEPHLFITVVNVGLLLTSLGSMVFRV